MHGNADMREVWKRLAERGIAVTATKADNWSEWVTGGCWIDSKHRIHSAMQGCKQ